MNKVEKMYEIVEQKMEKEFQSFADISEFIYDHPELGGEEYVSSNYLCDVLEHKGFKVIKPFGKLETAFVAEFAPEVISDDTPVVAFLAEYDALPGFGEDGGPGHACGHNWIAASMCGCAISLSEVVNDLNCRVQVIGTPAEESFGGKYDLINDGAFKDVDLVFQAHLDEYTSLETLSLAMNTIEFNFHGLAAHSAQNPEKGINALDAVISMYNNINAMRQHIKDRDRIHGIITNGGAMVNSVPDYAQCVFSMRSKTKGDLKVLRTKIENIANAAALATGATVEYHDIENPCDDMINVPAFVSVCTKHFNEYGYNDFIPEDEYPGSGSSDIGNVSYECPTVYLEFAPHNCEPVVVHDESAMSLVNSKEVVDSIKTIIMVYTKSAIDICSDKALMSKIKEQHKQILESRA